MAFLAPLLALLPEGLASLMGMGAAATEAGAAAASATEEAGLSGILGQTLGGAVAKNAGSIVSQGMNAAGMIIPQVMMMHQMNKQTEQMNQNFSGALRHD